MLFRNLIGVACAVVAVGFLAINSGILARGAAKWGFDTWERISYGAVAATVPWVIAMMPFLIVLSWRPGKRLGRPSIATLVGCAIWLAFVIYNLIGAAGSVAAVRDDVISMREHMAGVQHADKAARKRLTEELDAISKHRPAGALEPLIAAEKAKPAWEQTQRCTDIRRGRDNRFCGALTQLASELESAKRGAVLEAQLLALNAKLERAAPASEKVDPQARIIASFTGWSEDWISDRLPVATPVILELGSMTLLYFSFVLLGYSHRQALDAMVLTKGPRTAQDDRAKPAGVPLALVASIGSRAPLASITRQRELCEWFFRECTRPVSSGSMPESVWYGHYREICTRSADQPLPLPAFRLIAARFVPTIKEIDGETYYEQVLPLIPEQAA